MNPQGCASSCPQGRGPRVAPRGSLRCSSRCGARMGSGARRGRTLRRRPLRAGGPDLRPCAVTSAAAFRIVRRAARLRRRRHRCNYAGDIQHLVDLSAAARPSITTSWGARGVASGGAPCPSPPNGSPSASAGTSRRPARTRTTSWSGSDATRASATGRTARSPSSSWPSSSPSPGRRTRPTSPRRSTSAATSARPDGSRRCAR